MVVCCNLTANWTKNRGEPERSSGNRSEAYLVRERRAEWCWRSEVEGWRGSGRDEAARETSDERCLVAGARSSASRALPNRALRRRHVRYDAGRRSTQWGDGKYGTLQSKHL
ncbi:unnamed protein product [Boreogadus saida]